VLVPLPRFQRTLLEGRPRVDVDAGDLLAGWGLLGEDQHTTPL
jgi:hypothetical protein